MFQKTLVFSSGEPQTTSGIFPATDRVLFHICVRTLHAKDMGVWKVWFREKSNGRLGGLESTRKYHMSRLPRVSPNLVKGKTRKVDFHDLGILGKSLHHRIPPNWSLISSARDLSPAASGGGVVLEE